jgi:hypothetical protein
MHIQIEENKNTRVRNNLQVHAHWTHVLEIICKLTRTDDSKNRSKNM